MSKENDDKFEEWISEAQKLQLIPNHYPHWTTFKKCWDDGYSFGSKTNDRLKTEINILSDAYNTVANDIDRGEHVCLDWLKEAIGEASHSYFVNVLNKRIKELEQENKEMADRVKLTSNTL